MIFFQFRRRACEAFTAESLGYREICSAPGTAFAFETREVAHHGVAFLPALRTLSWRGDAGFGCCGSHRGQRVDAIDPSRDRSGSDSSTSGRHRSAATGRRDYAILLLLARLGLRSGEVAFLELDDIDWDAGQRTDGKSRCR